MHSHLPLDPIEVVSINWNIPLPPPDLCWYRGLSVSSGWASLRTLDLRLSDPVFNSSQTPEQISELASGLAQVLAYNMYELQCLKLAYTEPSPGPGCYLLDHILRRRVYLDQVRHLELEGLFVNWKRLRYFIERISQLQNLKLRHLYNDDNYDKEEPESVPQFADFVSGWIMYRRTDCLSPIYCEMTDVYRQSLHY